MDKLLKEFYINNIVRNIKSDKFNMNMLLRTKSREVSNILSLLFSPENINLKAGATIQFSADIDENGETIILYDNANKTIDENKFWGICLYLLKDYFFEKKILLPVSVPRHIEKLAIGHNLSIIYGDTDKARILNDLSDNKLYNQKRLMTDAIFFAVSLLDYLNLNNKTFKNLISSIPDAYTSIGRVNNAQLKESDIIDAVSGSNTMGLLNFNNGIKVYKDSGWVLIIPENSEKTITIITEAQSFEAADELCFNTIEKIKTCQKEKNSV